MYSGIKSSPRRDPHSAALTVGVLLAAATPACALTGVDRGQEATEAARARVVEAPPSVGSLKGLHVPQASNLGQFIKSNRAAIALGKALFWDMQAGSDGQACASCHFHAGADDRKTNQLSPGLLDENGPPVSDTFNPTASGAVGPNVTLTAADFPFHRLADPLDRNSAVLFDSDDTASSQGVFHAQFNSIVPGAPGDACSLLPDIFQVGGALVRRVEPRNTPTMINAAFNFRNFWDGRANNHFNGVSPFGRRDPGAVLHVVQGGVLAPIHVDLPNSSLASQAVGPAGSPFEMACESRSLPVLGRKLLALRALSAQGVDPLDSVLGPLRAPLGKGLSQTYAQLVKLAFNDPYWSSSATIDGFTLMESNFSLFWGLAIQAYEMTLVSDDSRFDRFADGNPLALTADEQAGLEVFKGKGQCINCHHGPEFTSAATALQAANEENALVERMIMGDGTAALYDSAFYNIGVRPTVEDRGVGRLDPFGNPLSFSRQAKIVAGGGSAVDPFHVDPATFPVNPSVPVDANERDAVDGAFKVPSLRNVALTGPYFHNGSKGTLEQVIEFYNRGGDRRGPDGNDTTGFPPNPTNLDPDIQPLGLTSVEKAALAAFLRSLTDERVRLEKAPFDHPQLFVPSGHATGAGGAVIVESSGRARTIFVEIPAVGAPGRAIHGLPPLGEFL
jgi:cytochrome c peroxidase